VADAALELDGLGKRYGDRVALQDLSFAVAAGQMFGFVGPNGAGKTTAMRAVVGVLAPTRGRSAEGGLATVLGIVPLSSPIVLPGRVALHAAGAGEVVLGLGVLVLSIPLAIALAGRLYRGGVLATGGRIKLGAALRMGREAGR
jgi:energy-coupling factor transporter ATP-binding protein EcfA2